MKSLLIFALCLVLYSASAQQNHFGVQKVSKGKDFSFPVFSQPNHQAVAKRINQLLQIGELELLKGHESSHIFEQVSTDRGTIYGGKVAISYSISANNNKLLSIGFDESSCGATCAYWVRYYNFNAGNGDLIQLKDLFTKAGYQAFHCFVTKRRVLQFKQELLKLKADERKGFDDIIAAYEDDDLSDYYVKGDELFIDGENSFSKNQKFDGIETVCKFKLNEFKAYLNSYGKVLFAKDSASAANFRSYSLPQLYTGKIGTENILLLLVESYKDNYRGEYVYEKFGKGIFLEGQLKNGILVLTENDSDFKPNGTIEAKLERNKLTGTWTNADQTKTYKIAVSKE